MLKDPSIIEVNPAASVSSNIEQKVLFVRQIHKSDLLTDVLKNEKVHRALVFTRTKRAAEYILRLLLHRGMSVDAIHSDKNQKERQGALAAFDRGQVRVLVATDVVARGIDVDGISHVINYELPNDPESYVHRIGRTARAGAIGTAMSFCDAGEVTMLKGIEKLTQRPLITVDNHPFHSNLIASMYKGTLGSGNGGTGSRLRRKSKPRSRANNRRYV
jgi:ATP-dependent RNA helicase RhlE